MNRELARETEIAHARQEAQKTPKRRPPHDVFVNLYTVTRDDGTTYTTVYGDAYGCPYEVATSITRRKASSRRVYDMRTYDKFHVETFAYLGTLVTRPSGETFIADFEPLASRLINTDNMMESVQ